MYLSILNISNRGDRTCCLYDLRPKPPYLLIRVEVHSCQMSGDRRAEYSEHTWSPRAHKIITSVPGSVLITLSTFLGLFLILSTPFSVDCRSVKVWHVSGCSGYKCQQFYLGGGQCAAAESGKKILKCPLLVHSTIPPTAPAKERLTNSWYQNQLSEQHRVIAVLVKCNN